MIVGEKKISAPQVQIATGEIKETKGGGKERTFSGGYRALGGSDD